VEVDIKKILVIEEEDAIRQNLVINLTNLGYIVISASDGKEAIEIFDKEQPHLVVLNIVSSQFDGYKVYKTIREKAPTPIIILTSLGSPKDRVRGLHLGADDFVIKPFFPEELEARISSFLQGTNNQINTPNNEEKVYRFSDLIFNKSKRQIARNDSITKLTKIEASLLELLIMKAGTKLSRASILDNIWGYTPERNIDMRIVDVHIARLRSKLEEDPSKPDFILTVRGTGYLFQKD
jgi:OmpR family response regulator RpaB